MRPANLVFILSDEHNRNAAGCYGHPIVRTPNLDSLASRGTLFRNAYTPCPICVPARASLATGRWVHQIGFWDNAFPYDGTVASWHHRLRDQGFIVSSIGKLHFRSPEDDNGFTEEIDPLHVVDGVGDLLGAIRDDPPVRRKLDGVRAAGAGSSTYLDYDARIAGAACDWIREHASDARPWVLFVSFVCPHPPYVSPQRLYDLYPLESIPLPPQWRAGDLPDHPALVRMREKFGLEELDEWVIRNATAAYLGACTYLDERIGEVMGAIETAGLSSSTRVIYSSDHGECLGARGLFGKFTMYEESAAIPLIIAGPGVPEGRSINTPVSLIDCFPTIVEAVGARLTGMDADLPGRSLWQIAAEPVTAGNRGVISEYHAVNSEHGIFMLRSGRYKYVHYVAEPPQLFDLDADPGELNDLSLDPHHVDLLRAMAARLREIVDPEAVDARARFDQAEKIESFGGREAVIRRGTFDNSPIPGEAPAFRAVHE